MKPIITNYNEETGDFRVVTPVPFTLKDGIEYAGMIVADIPKYEDIKDYNVFDLIRENQELKEQLEASEKARKEAIEYIKNNPLYEEEYDYNYDDELELLGINSNQAECDLLDILNIDKQIDKYAERINNDPRYDDLKPIEFREHINFVKEQMMKDIDKGE